MTQKLQQPDLARVKARSARFQEVLQRADANLVILDHIIAELEADIRKQPMYLRRLQKAKQLLNIDLAEVSGSSELEKL
jgi:hypothetical protein